MITIPHSPREKYYRAKQREFNRINKQRALEGKPPLEWKPFWAKESKALKTLEPTKPDAAMQTNAQYLPVIRDKNNNRHSNQEMMAFNAALMKIRTHADINNIDTLYSCAEEYIALCTSMDMRVTNLSLYFACGVSKEMVDNWYSGKSKSKDPEYLQFAKYCREFCAMARAQTAEEGMTNPVWAIWQQKVFEGYRDDIKPISASTEKEGTSSDSIAAKYEDFTE